MVSTLTSMTMTFGLFMLKWTTLEEQKMKITGTTLAGYTEPSTRTRNTPSAEPTAGEDWSNTLTDADKSFLLNGLGVRFTIDRDGTLNGIPTRPMSDEETGAAIGVALQIASGRHSGRLQGEVSTTYLTDLLARAKNDSTQAFQDALQRGIDYLVKGSPLTKVDTRA